MAGCDIVNSVLEICNGYVIRKVLWLADYSLVWIMLH